MRNEGIVSIITVPMVQHGLSSLRLRLHGNNIVGETGARCNNFAFELHNFLRKKNKPKQNITFGSPFS